MNDFNFEELESLEKLEKLKSTPIPAPDGENAVLENLQQIEQFILEQSDMLAHQVDATISKISSTIGTLSQELGRLGALSGKKVKMVSRFVALGKGLSEVGGAVVGAYARNKMIGELLWRKMSVAAEHHEAVDKMLHFAQENLDLSARGMLALTDRLYDLGEYSDPQKMKLLAENLGIVYSIYRANVYAVLILEYLQSEYAAWLAGNQHGEKSFPTLRDATRLSLDKLQPESRQGAHTVLVSMLTHGLKGREIAGWQLLYLTNEPISAYLLSVHCHEGVSVDLAEQDRFRCEKLANLTTDLLPRQILAIIHTNPTIEAAIDYGQRVTEFDSKPWWSWRWKPALYSSGVMIAAGLVTWFTPIPLFVKIFIMAVELLLCVIWYDYMALKAHRAMARDRFLVSNTMRRHLLCKAGYIYREEPDVEKKNLIVAGLSKAFE